MFLIKSDKLSIKYESVSATRSDSCVVLLGQEKDSSACVVDSPNENDPSACVVDSPNENDLASDG